MIDTVGRQSRLLIVSNRLPFTVVEENGKQGLVKSSGGLVSGLSAYLNRIKDPTISEVTAENLPYIWVGWPGTTVPENKRAQLKHEALEHSNAYPVFVDEEAMDKFYHGFCNKTIWPLFHYFPSYTNFSEEYWEEYRQVNQTFADAVLEIARPGDTVWVHDYQLMLLPQLLREQMPELTIGFFLHIPFPGFEIYRLMPKKWGHEILRGMLGADLIGFHTHEYTQYFQRNVMRELGYEHNLGEMLVSDRLVKADTFPMGIDFDQFHDAINTPEVQAEKKHLQTSIRDAKLVLSIDRLDYTKGILSRLKGFEQFLEGCPEWHNKVVLALVIVPSRVAVERYQETKQQIEEIVGRVNGKFGSIAWTPITYQYRSIPFPTLIAMYNVSDVALITPLRDGMNLIAKEYIAARDTGGVLILSEFAGAAKELGEAIQVNPNSREEIANALKAALEMPVEEQESSISAMQERLRRYTVLSWVEDFIEELKRTKEAQSRFKARLLSADIREKLLHEYRHGKRRLIMLDYDGTLVPFNTNPDKAVPGDDLRNLLKQLAGKPGNDVVLISGRVRSALERWFGDLPVGLVAEHGVWTRRQGEEWALVQPLSGEWKGRIRPVLELYANRLPGSFIEEKEFSVAWHYRGADNDLGPARAKELLDHLVNYTANIEVQVLQGNKVIEVKTAGVSKGTTGLQWLGSDSYDFVLAMGDDWTDEHLFMALPPEAYSVRVGMVQSYARYNLKGYMDVLRLLEQMAEAAPDGAAPAGAPTFPSSGSKAEDSQVITAGSGT